MTDAPPIYLAPWVARVVWLSPDLKCPAPGCGWAYRAARGSGDLWLICQSKRCKRTRWRAISVYPGMIGATLVALFGFEEGPNILHRIHPETKKLSEEDQLAYPLIESGCEYLQWAVSKLEAHRDSQDPQLGNRILKALGTDG